MGRPLKAPIVLLCAGGLLAGSLLCGCLSLSFGGKHEHLETSPSNGATAVTLLQNMATTQKLEQIESRLQSLEERCRNCPAETDAGGEGTPRPILPSPTLSTPALTMPVETP
jgi:hypothetical protein